MSVDKPFRIIMHWTAGTNNVSDLDREHYHSITDGNGLQHFGIHRPEANNNTSDGAYAAHTKNCNTGAIGMAMAAMHGTTPPEAALFDPGRNRINMIQLKCFVDHVAEMAEIYGIPTSGAEILSHAEVQPTLGIKQNGKWDIAWLPGMERPGDPVHVGDILRGMIVAARYVQRMRKGALII